MLKPCRPSARTQKTAHKLRYDAMRLATYYEAITFHYF